MNLYKKNLTVILAILIAVSLSLPVFATSLKDFTVVRPYNNVFTDVKETDWFYDEVAAAYSLGIIGGKSATSYDPSGALTIAETIKLAVSCYQLLSGGSVFTPTSTGSNWYDGYVSYAKEKGIVTEDYENYTAPALRSQVAVLFSRAAVNSGLTFTEINPLEPDTIKDVSTSDWFVYGVHRLYKWGVMTGDGNGYIMPNSTVKRSEIAAVVIRMIDEESRVDLDPSDNPPSYPNTPEDREDPPSDPTPSYPSVLLYEGDMESKNFTGITGFAADFQIINGTSYVDAEYSMNLLNHVTLESDNISFRLYNGVGFEALGIVRGWLNNAAVGMNGSKVNDASPVYASANELVKIWINQKAVKISEIWYYNHGDYTTYAFYFTNVVDTTAATDIKWYCGRLSNDLLIENGLDEVVTLLETAEPEDPPVDPPTDDPVDPDAAYKKAVSDAKTKGSTVLFEYENERCLILYGSGFYSKGGDEYRLLFIFRDGTVQTIAAQKLLEIRMNDKGDVLYYSVTAPDNQSIQYGVNFG